MSHVEDETGMCVVLQWNPAEMPHMDNESRMCMVLLVKSSTKCPTWKMNPECTWFYSETQHKMSHMEDKSRMYLVL